MYKNMNLVVGSKIPNSKPSLPYNKLVCSFIEDVSINLNKFSKANKYSDLKTFLIILNFIK